MERIYQIDGETAGTVAFLGNYRALTAAEALHLAQVWSQNRYERYTVFAVFPARD